MSEKIPLPQLRVYLIRHGEIENPDELRLDGHRDVALSQYGEEQMLKVARALSQRSVKKIISSDLYRARRGAEILAKLINIQPDFKKELREFHFGDWEGKSWKEIMEKLNITKGLEKDWENFQFPGGENLLSFSRRVLDFYLPLVKEEQGEIAIFAHGGTNRVILSQELNLSLKNFFRIDQAYACVNIIDYFSAPAQSLVPVIRLINGNYLNLMDFISA